MAFLDRIVQHPGRVKLMAVSGETDVYDMTREEGEILEGGTLLNANNLNVLTQLDNGVKTRFNSAGMTSGTYQNDMSDALGFLLGKAGSIATGTNNGWTFIKLTSTLFIATRQVTPSLAIQTAMGSLFTTDEYNLALPNFAQSVLFIAGDANGSRWVTMTNVGTSPKWRLFSATSAAASATTIDFFVVGTY